MSDDAAQSAQDADFLEGIPIGKVWQSSRRKLTEGEFALLHDLIWSVDAVHSDIEYTNDIDIGLKDRNLSGALVIAVGLGLIGTTKMRMVLPPLRIRLLPMLGINNARFRASLYPGDTIYVRTELTGARASRSLPGRGVMTLTDRVYNQTDTLLCEFERTCLFDRPPFTE